MTAIILSLSLILGVAAVSPSSTEATAQLFKNCTELNKKYSGGVAKDSKVRNRGGATKYKPCISAALYKANISKDRDKDGIACER